MSDAEIGCYESELLPARTVLSMRSAGIQGVLGGNGGDTAGAAGAAASHSGASQANSFDLLWWLNQPGMANPDSGGAGSIYHISGSEFGHDGANANGHPG